MRITLTTALLGLTALALVASCETAPVPQASAPPASRLAPRAVSSVPLSRVSGLLTAPASLIANNSSSIVSNHSSGLIANNSSSFRLLAAEAWQPAAAVRITVVDVFGRLVRGAATTTATDGSFVLEMPTAGTWIVRGHMGEVELSTLVRPSMGLGPVVVNPATSLATQSLLKTYANRRGSLQHVPQEAFEQMIVALQASVEKLDVELDMSSDEAAAATLDRVLRADEAAAAAVSELTTKTDAAVEAALEQGLSDEEQLTGPPPEPLPEVTQVEEVAEATPTPPAPTSTPTAPAEGASPAPSTRPTATPKPSPASGAAQQLLEQNECSFCELGGADLKDADLGSSHLSFADLAGADLSGADLRGANLRYADLRHAKLAGATLDGANLKYADLRGADLRGASLQKTNLSYAALSDANMAGADMTKAQLKYAEFSGAIWHDGRTCASGSRGDCR